MLDANFKRLPLGNKWEITSRYLDFVGWVSEIKSAHEQNLPYCDQSRGIASICKYGRHNLVPKTGLLYEHREFSCMEVFGFRHDDARNTSLSKILQRADAPKKRFFTTKTHVHAAKGAPQSSSESGISVSVLPAERSHARSSAQHAYNGSSRSKNRASIQVPDFLKNISFLILPILENIFWKWTSIENCWEWKPTKKLDWNTKIYANNFEKSKNTMVTSSLRKMKLRTSMKKMIACLKRSSCKNSEGNSLAHECRLARLNPSKCGSAS